MATYSSPRPRGRRGAAADQVVSHEVGSAVVDRVIRETIAKLPMISLLMIDTDLRYRAALGEAVNPYGYPPEELVGRRVRDVLPDAVRQLVEPRLLRALAGETFAETMATPNDIGVYEVRYSPAVVDGVLVGVVVVVQDVTVEQRALKELATLGGPRRDASNGRPRHVDLHAELREGLRRGELTLYYQPIVDLATRQVVSREALLRWEHPTRGLLLPAAFLGGLDHSSLAVELGEFVLRRACADAVSWPDGAAVNVNVSARQLAEPGLADVVDSALRDAGMDVERLIVEITESFVLAASPVTMSTTRALVDMGVVLSLDDFGTGYSSLTALHWLPIDAFKIDRSFIEGLPEDRTSAGLVDGLLALAAHMELDVVAEGIETCDQAQWLLAHGCRYGQGYHLGRPAPLPNPAVPARRQG